MLKRLTKTGVDGACLPAYGCQARTDQQGLCIRRRISQTRPSYVPERFGQFCRICCPFFPLLRAYALFLGGENTRRREYEGSIYHHERDDFLRNDDNQSERDQSTHGCN